MARRFALISLAVLSFAGMSVAAEDAGPSRAKLGERIPNLVFRDADGGKHPLHDLKNQKAIVVVFLSFECPVSKSYSKPLVDLHKELGKHGVTFLGLTVNPDDTAAEVAKSAKEYDLDFPVYRDEGLAAAQAMEANNTPEVFVLDGDFKLRYRGRIDNRYSNKLKQHQPTKLDLSQALGEILSGRPVAEPATKAVGCTIDRDAKPVEATAKATYYRDVLPILQNNCQACHRPGESGPFALMNYAQAKNWAADIKDYTQKRVMPPWKPSAGVAMHHERRLTDKEIATIADWADHGTPAGEPKDAPPERKFTEGWQLGTPDLVLEPSDDYIVGPTGKDRFRCFVMPTGLPKDEYVTAVEIRAGNSRIVHHLLLFVDATGGAKKLELAEQAKKPAKDGDHAGQSAEDRGPGYTVAMGIGIVPQGGLSGWSPGITPRFLPEGAGFYLPKNSDVVMQVHYHRDGKLEKDRTKIGLYFAKKPVEHVYASGAIAGGKGTGFFNMYFSIPAGDDAFKLTGERYATKDFTLYSISPHMHLIGKSIKLTMTPPDGKTATLLAIDQWDYNWQEIYMLKEPIAVKAGTKFQVEAVYDNSDKNPMNPSSPPRRVTFGEETTNEMCFVFLGGTPGVLRPSGSRSLPLSTTAPTE
jgi:peroxiredoxin/mono/diheme cytochrome c family protein